MQVDDFLAPNARDDQGLSFRRWASSAGDSWVTPLRPLQRFMPWHFPAPAVMDSLIDLNDASKALDLNRIRYQLIRLEDTITYHLIERAQFALNRSIYIPGALNIPDSELSFVDWYLREQERLQSIIRRYESPDEYPFFPDVVQKPILKPLNYPKILHPNNVDLNDKIRRFYVDSLLPAMCPDFGRSEDRGESQENYGSSATCDIACLQALSRRIHFGKFVAESKFVSERERFVKLIKAEDRKGIADAITKPEVEKKVLERLRLKVTTYGTDPSNATIIGDVKPKIDVDAVVSMYENFVIPLTKEVEVEYLMQRLEETD
ncbi:Chorismate mutase like protein [Verticillium longisporum]|uniref:Chorismate mutase n=2 Tax=Verticillium longisporum TaxID=100787 RepID=A0A8I3AK64_VERLO|nr:Chorismate mutase like protein [Verticillium longisporum]KAG7123019.1 Chorismate mutase like protein [Verticillium longisporum]